MAGRVQAAETVLQDLSRGGLFRVSRWPAGLYSFINLDGKLMAQPADTVIAHNVNLCKEKVAHL